MEQVQRGPGGRALPDARAACCGVLIQYVSLSLRSFDGFPSIGDTIECDTHNNAHTTRTTNTHLMFWSRYNTGSDNADHATRAKHAAASRQGAHSLSTPSSDGVPPTDPKRGREATFSWT